MKRKIKVYGRINLYETSAVGLPAYPDAHFDTTLSLTKSLSSFMMDEDEGIKKFKFEEGNQMETETEKSVEVETKTEKIETKTAEAKEDINALIAKAVKEAVKETVKEIETERGLVAKETDNTKKSLGELTLEMFRRDMR
jgi:hypothetical protein